MEYFLQNETGDEVDRIVARLNKLMDGDVSGQMKDKGVDYKLNYGASVLWLKNLAREYEGDNRLAERLWLREIRETMIIATWMNGIVSDELAEQIGMNLLWRIENVKDFSFRVLKNEKERQRAAVWIGLTVFMQRGEFLSKEDVAGFLLILKNDIFDSRLSQRAKGRFLRQLCRKDKRWISEVEDLLRDLSVNGNMSWLLEDVYTEITYLKS